MTDRRKYNRKRKDRYALAGWLLFILCAVFYLASSLKNHDLLAVIGSGLFLIACLVFMVPLVRPDKKAIRKTEGPDEMDPERRIEI